MSVLFTLNEPPVVGRCVDWDRRDMTLLYENYIFYRPTIKINRLTYFIYIIIYNRLFYHLKLRK